MHPYSAATIMSIFHGKYHECVPTAPLTRTDSEGDGQVEMGTKGDITISATRHDDPGSDGCRDGCVEANVRVRVIGNRIIQSLLKHSC